MVTWRPHFSLLALIISNYVLCWPAVADLGEVIATYGNWDVRRSVDMMTDEVTCVATHVDNSSIQLSDDVLYISIKGGPQGFRYRVDSDHVTDLQLVSDTETEIGAIGFKQEHFRALLGASRLRIQVVTYLSIENLDIDLSGFSGAHTHVASACK